MKITAKIIKDGYTILDLWENKEFMRMIMLLETLKGKEKQNITNWLMKMVSIQPKYKGLEKHIITSHNLEDF